MALVQRLFLSLLIFLMVLHSGAANYAPQKSQEAADSLEDSLAAWKKDGLEPLDELGAHVEADGLQKSPASKHMQNPTVLPKSGEKKETMKAGQSPQEDPRHSEKAGETTKQNPNAHEHIGSIFCPGTGSMVGIAILVVALPAGILVCCFLATCWWCRRKRRIFGEQEERARLITHSDSQTSSPEPALPLQ